MAWCDLSSPPLKIIVIDAERWKTAILREKGYKGRLRAVGGLISDQYAMARRVGFDEVRIPAALAARQPQEQWLYRADWQDWDHRSRLAG